MTVEITIGEAVVTPTYQNTYELDIEFMHGDADGETHQTVRYDESEIDELKQTLGAFAYLGRKLDGDMEDCDELVAYFKSLGMNEDDAEDAKDSFRDNFYEGDITCEGRPAAIASVTVTYYDDEGVHRNVDVRVNGSQL